MPRDEPVTMATLPERWAWEFILNGRDDACPLHTPCSPLAFVRCFPPLFAACAPPRFGASEIHRSSVACGASWASYSPASSTGGRRSGHVTGRQHDRDGAGWPSHVGDSVARRPRDARTAQKTIGRGGRGQTANVKRDSLRRRRRGRVGVNSSSGLRTNAASSTLFSDSQPRDQSLRTPVTFSAAATALYKV